jgi:hypothetical protein
VPAAVRHGSPPSSRFGLAAWLCVARGGVSSDQSTVSAAVSLYSHPPTQLSLRCLPAVRVRELQRGPGTWLNTRVWIQNTARSPASLSHPQARSNPDWLSNHRPPCTARRNHQPCDLPAAYITSRASGDECASIPRCVDKTTQPIPTTPRQASYRVYVSRH